jgi:hypothetical protein
LSAHIADLADPDEFKDTLRGILPLGEPGTNGKHKNGALEQALELEAAGYWTVPIYAKGETIPSKTALSDGKNPWGKGWGLQRRDKAFLIGHYRNHPKRGIGICFGPDRAPGGRWLIDLEGDGERAAFSLSLVLGTDQELLTPSWDSRRGGHTVFALDELDALRLLELLGRAGATESKELGKAGVYHLAALPDLEWRIGGYKDDGITVKQVQSVVPPTVGENGVARTWRTEPSVPVADLPPSAFAVLETLIELAAGNARTNGVAPEVADHAIDDSGRDPLMMTARSSVSAYGRKALEGEINEFSRQGEGNRHACLLKTTLRLASLVKAGVLTSEACRAGLKDGARQNGMGEGRFQEIDDAWDSAYAMAQARVIPESTVKPKDGRGSVEDQAAAAATNPPTFNVEPRPLAPDLVPVPEMIPEMIPEPFREWLKDIADRGCFPIEYVASSLIVTLSGLIARKIAIRPKRYDDWTVVPNLWGSIVGPPGFLKSPAVEAVMKPLKRLVVDAQKAHRDEEAEYNARKLVAEAKQAGAKKQLDAAAKSGATDEELNALAKSALKVSDEPKPIQKRYLVNDFTVEKLGEILVENPRGLTIFRDELTGLLNTLNREGHQSDRSFLLEGWNGNGSYSWDRIGRGTIHIPHVCLALFGTIQPGPLARYMKGTINGEEADGFIPRFQVLVYPDPPKKYVHVDRWPDKDAKNEAYEVFKAIDQLDPIAGGCKTDDDGLPYVNFTSDAQAFFNEWYTSLQTRLRDGQLSNVIAAHLAKYGSLMPSLALIFHVVGQSRTNLIGDVPIEAAEAAAAWCELLEAHASRVYQSCADGDISAAVSLGERIKASLPQPFTFREVAKKGWSGLGNDEDVRKAVGLLEDRGWVKVVEVPSSDPNGRGRPSEKIWVNPKVQAGVPEVNA